MREASHTTNEYCGDGTTTVSILANSILEKGMKMLDAGYNPIDIKRGMELARDEIIEFFEMMSEPLDTREKIMNAALVRFFEFIFLRFLLTMMKKFPM